MDTSTIIAKRQGKGSSRGWLYPFLFALYPVLFLYLRNIREVAPVQALLAATASLGIALGYWLLTRLFTRRTDQRALLLFLFLLLFHFFGLYFDQVAMQLPRTFPLPEAFALAFILPGAAWLFLSRAVLRRSEGCAPLNRILGTAVICLTAWNLGGILVHHGRSFYSRMDLRHSAAPPAAQRPGAGPDIYCFILDEFAAIESARSLFRYNNSAFVRSLRQHGFFVAHDSRAPYNKTEFALASFLNLGEYDGRSDPFPLIRRNAVAGFLKQRGYRIIEFPVSPAFFMEAADETRHYSLLRVSIFFDDFYRALFERSLLCFLPAYWRRHTPDSSRYYRERVLQVFEKLPGVVQGPGPKFVFVHLYCPHEPFVFNARGGAAAAGHLWDHAHPGFYLQQYIFVSRMMAETAAMILKDSRQPPVIIIQSDHGYRGSLGRKTWVRKVDAVEATKVFNALYLPGVLPDTIDPSLSPLNNFRLVFNSYFKTDYPLLRCP